MSTAHFELVRYSTRISRRSKFLFYIREKKKPMLLVRTSQWHFEAGNIMEKFERLYPCHFLAKEWQRGKKVKLRKIRK